MKINRIGKGFHGKWVFKYDLKMKLTTLLLLVSIFAIKANNSYSQNTKISLALENATIEEVFGEIESLTDFRFFYNHRKIDVTKKVSINVVEERISNILNELFSRSNIYFKVRKKQIIVKTGKTTTPQISSPVPKEDFQDQIRGTITDNAGTPLPGVNIIVQGIARGTQSDFDGNYSISASEGDVLIFSYIGFTTQNITVGSSPTIDVTMQESASELDEVVVVGYGTEIKKNLTSAVSSVDTDDLQVIPATSLSNAIAGRAAGVLVTTVGGRPGTSSDIIIRGAVTGAGLQGSSAPLYVIDNVIATKDLFDLLDVNEVESISILKDAAAAAVYGARASNGVVLVTTKSGKTGKPQLQFTTSVGSSSILRQVKHTTAYEQALLVNQSVAFGNESDTDNIPPSLHGVDPIPDNILDYFRENDFGNFEEQSRRSPIEKRYALNISGGTDIVSYFLAGSMIDQEGIVEQLNYDKYNVRAKVDVNLSDNLRISLNTDLSSDEDYQYYWPFDNTGRNSNLFDSYRQATRRGNFAPAYINGLPVANFNAFNVSNFFDNAGLGNRTRTTDVNNFTVGLQYKVPFVEGLVASANYNKRAIANYDKIFRKPTVDYVFATDPDNPYRLTNEVINTRPRQFGGADGHSLSREYLRDDTYQLNLSLRYDRTFGDHSINASFNYEQYEFEREFLFARRRNPISDDIQQLFATSPADEDIFSTGSAAEAGRLSYIGTLGYNYKEKYFLNGTFRYDGSTEFREGDRYGFFPSVSAAWIMSEEDFWGDDNFIDFLKIRASFGRTGNDDLDPDNDLPTFRYLQGFQQTGNFIFGDGNLSSLVIRDRGFPATNFTWDRTDSYNLGIDFEFLNRRLSGGIDVFKNNRTNLFGSRNSILPVLVGADAPPENYGEIEVKGLELLFNYKDNIGKLSYDIGLNFAYTRDKLVVVDENDALRPFEIRTGGAVNQPRGYRVDGLIRSQEQLDELLASGYQAFNQDPYLGMPFYRDIRGNSVDDPNGNTPDGVVDANDIDLLHRTSTAPINYGISLGLKYKNFSLDVFIQGLEGHKNFDPASGRFIFDVLEESAWSRWNDAFDPVTNPNGSLPRVVNYWSRNTHLLQDSELWLQDAGFARLRNLNFAYNLPKEILDKAGIKNARIFFNGANLGFIYSKIKEYDPELFGSGIPLNRTYSLGLQFTL